MLEVDWMDELVWHQKSDHGNLENFGIAKTRKIPPWESCFLPTLCQNTPQTGPGQSKRRMACASRSSLWSHLSVTKSSDLTTWQANLCWVAELWRSWDSKRQGKTIRCFAHMHWCLKTWVFFGAACVRVESLCFSKLTTSRVIRESKVISALKLVHIFQSSSAPDAEASALCQHRTNIPTPWWFNWIFRDKTLHQNSVLKTYTEHYWTIFTML